MVDKETQIKILLYGNAFHFACETLGVKNMYDHSYSEVFTVSKEEVLAYTAVHGLPHNERTGKEDRNEGFHFYEEDGEWVTFFRERGHIYDEKKFKDSEPAHRYIVETWLKLSGTGLF
ncbi:hypothetical protein [Planococcus ruber]|uniref:hypothetical protein n=1 Tax=Planococcus ruber TaxID=2027871 RepID=UPI001FEE2BC1|nr:hypothetical protein [Planococcus ruber]MCJ1907652.1 hypothetical protein [Planococcus ruber]